MSGPANRKGKLFADHTERLRSGFLGTGSSMAGRVNHGRHNGTRLRQGILPSARPTQSLRRGRPSSLKSCATSPWTQSCSTSAISATTKTRRRRSSCVEICCSAAWRAGAGRGSRTDPRTRPTDQPTGVLQVRLNRQRQEPRRGSPRTAPSGSATIFRRQSQVSL